MSSYLVPILLTLAAFLYVWSSSSCVFGHRVEVFQHFGESATRLVCDRCGGDWVRKERGEHAGAVLPFDEDFAELYGDVLGYPIRRRDRRLIGLRDRRRPGQ